MAGFASYDDLIEQITVNEQSLTYEFSKGPFNAQGAGIWYSINGAAGFPGDTAAGAFVIPDRSPAITKLLTFGAMITTGGTVMLYDRLYYSPAAISLAGGSQVVNSTPLPRYADGAGVEAWVSVSVGTTGSGGVGLLSYTNQDGVAGRTAAATSFPFTSTNVSTFLGPLPLQSGDTGIRSVETVSVNSTSGSGLVVLLRPLVRIPLSASAWTERDLGIQIESFPTLFAGANLALAWQATNTSTTTISGQIGTGWG